MSSANSNHSDSPVHNISMHQQQQQQQQQLLLQLLLTDQPLNMNQFLQLQQYQQFFQQHQLQQQLPNTQLMASPMGQNSNNSNANFNQQQVVGNYPAPYQQQNFMQYFQYQLLQQQQQQQYYPNAPQHQQLQANIASSQISSQLASQQSQQHQSIAQPPVQQYIPQNNNSTAAAASQFTPPMVATNSPQVVNVSPHIGSSSNNNTSANRKRQRRSDHALPGDEGDTELKELLYKALEVPFEEFAAQVRIVENGASRISSPGANDRPIKEEESTKERKRQIFGMVCLIRSCQLSPKAVVPRNRIYAGYASICASHGVIPLSAASFGKLVRILFPTITTRRLGMRGQSKYHYCGIQLIGDTNSPFNSPSAAQTPSGSPFTTPRTNNSLEGTTGNSPMSIVSTASSITNINQTFIGTSHSSTPVTLDSDLKHYITPNLKFSTNLLIDLQNSQLELSTTDIDNNLTILNLPSIQPFVPPNVDKDVAATLESLYKSHCNSVFESLRYMQLKKLFNCISSFAFSLTSPVYKLYTSDSIQPWVISCDVIMYQSVMRMLSKLALQKIPAFVSQQLRYIIKNYTEKFQVALKKLPIEFTRLKLRPAENFVRLTSRLSKVSNSSTSASKILLNIDERQKMLNDWEKCDFKYIIDKDVPCSNTLYTDRINIICTKEVPELLNYDPFSELVDDQSNEDEKLQKLHVLLIGKWTQYLSSLPHQFPTIPPRMFLLCLSSLLTTTLREMTLLEGESFGAWWIIRCWVDDWLSWCAELTGFLGLDDNLRVEEEGQQQLDANASPVIKMEVSKENEEFDVVEPTGNTNEVVDDLTASADDVLTTHHYTKEDPFDIQNAESDEIDLLNI